MCINYDLHLLFQHALILMLIDTEFRLTILYLSIIAAMFVPSFMSIQIIVNKPHLARANIINTLIITITLSNKFVY